MAEGRKPDYRVMFPVKETKEVNGKVTESKTVWHRHGAAWTRPGGTIGIVLNLGVPITYQAGAQLVLVEEKEDGREPGDEDINF
jgi:hypothetical protein